jgi:tetratricopeptide (TPR) repeat protein
MTNLIVWSLYILKTKKLQVTVTPFTLPALFIGLVFLLSALFGSQNPYDAIMGRGVFIPALALLTFISINTLSKKKFVDWSIFALVISATVLSFISIFQSLGFGISSIINNLLSTNIPNTLAFTPAGSPVALITFLAPVLIIALFFAATRKETLEKVILFLLSAIITAALVLVVYYSFPGKDTAPVYLPHQYGYAIAMETLKNPQTLLFGYGPEQFANAYQRSRPASLNLTDYWNIRFTSSSNEIFQAITTLGILGLFSWLWLALASFRTIKRSSSTKYGLTFKIAIAGIFLLFLLIPATYLHLFTFFVIIMIWSIYLKATKDPLASKLNLDLSSIRLVRPDATANSHAKPVPILPFLVAIPAITLSFAVFYFSFRAYSAEMTFKQSLDAAVKNDGLATYNLQRQAILKNPFNSRYHRAYSATNLALANSIAGKENPTDEDRQNISQLIQQSIREAKAAVALDPQNSLNWENLTFVYRSLINVAQNADSWTVAALAQAIQNNPTNPQLRLELGGVYYSLERYDQAIRMYQQAAELKPDWANAYYNLAAAHKQKKELAQAYDYLRQVLRLVPQDSADYTKAQAEIEELAKVLNLNQANQEGQQSPAPQGELQTPSVAPTPNPESQVDLPEAAGPEDVTEEEVVNPAEVEETTPSPSPTQ